MEYRKAYWEEEPDNHLIERHKREIFPLLRRRYLFSGAAKYTLFDFYVNEGYVNEDVFAFTNMVGSERALVLYNNSYNNTSGWIRQSTRINIGRGQETNFITRTLSEALELNTSSGVFYIFRDHQKGLEFIRSGKELHEMGLYAELHGYQYSVLLDFREVHDPDGSWRELTSRLGGRGTQDISYSHRELELTPMLDAFRDLLAEIPEIRDISAPNIDNSEVELKDISAVFSAKADAFLEISSRMKMITGNIQQYKEKITANIFKYFSNKNDPVIDDEAVNLLILGTDKKTAEPDKTEDPGITADIWNEYIQERMLIWSILEPFSDEIRGKTSDWIDNWLLAPAIVRTIIEQGGESQYAWDNINIMKAMLDFSEAFSVRNSSELADIVFDVFKCPYLQDFLRINKYQNEVWFNKERYNTIIFNLYIMNSIFNSSDNETDCKKRNEILLESAIIGEFQVQRTIDVLRNIRNDDIG